ncbi:MAG: TOMM system kinase/cyclase fusion protein, partial [Moraxellaceae bacterium]
MSSLQFFLRENLKEMGEIKNILKEKGQDDKKIEALKRSPEQSQMDIKPSNIMLTRSGLKQHVKILDFGIGTFQKDARQAGFQTLTLTQETLGTPSYSAPEQLRGEPPTPKTDLYLWGLVFIECLTGRPAVSGNSIAAIFHKQLNSENIPMPQELASHPCATLLRRVLQKKANDRAARADEIYQELKFINFSSLVFPIEAKKLFELAADAPNVEDTVINLGNTTASVNTERKQITFLAVRTGLNGLIQSQSDDEVIDTLLRDHKNSIVDVAQRFGGYFVGNLGSLLLFYFGYPSVSENDSRLAARAALEISTGAMQRGGVLCAQQGFNFTVHLGFHSARLTTYPDTVPEGRCVDFALDLANMALPNQILCSETAKNVLDIYIEFERHKLALNEPVYEMSGERQLEAMGFLRANRTAYDMVGRDQELQQLINYSINSPTNAPSIMHVYGEAGIGKSRLLLELRTRLKTCKQLIAQCLPEHQYSGLHPLLVLLRNWYGLDSVAHDVALERIKTALMASGIEEQAASLAVLAVWLDIPLPPATYPIVSSKEHRKVLFAGIFALIDEIFKSYSPTVLILEDIHWADSLTLEFIRKVAAPSDEFNHSIKLITTSRQRGISELT